MAVWLGIPPGQKSGRAEKTMVVSCILFLFLVFARSGGVAAPEGGSGSPSGVADSIESGNATPVPETASSPVAGAGTTASRGSAPPRRGNQTDDRTSSLTVYELLSLTVGAVSCLTVIVTLRILTRQTTYLAKQTENMAKSLASQSYGDIVAKLTDAIKIIVEDDKLYPYFFEGKELAQNKQTRRKVTALAKLLLTLLDCYLAQDADFDGFPQKEGWEEFIIDIFSSSPVMRTVLSQHPRMYSQELVDYMQQGVSQALLLEQGNEHPDSNKVRQLLLLASNTRGNSGNHRDVARSA